MKSVAVIQRVVTAKKKAVSNLKQPVVVYRKRTQDFPVPVIKRYHPARITFEEKNDCKKNREIRAAKNFICNRLFKGKENVHSKE